MRRRLILGACTVAPVRGARADALAAAGWRFIAAPGRRAARAWQEADATLVMEADRAVGFLVRPLTPAEAQAPRLAWRWRVDAAPPGSDLSVAGADDRPAAVHLAYPAAGGFPSFGSLLGLGALSGRLLSYVWGGTAPPGTRLATPGSRGRAAQVVRRGPEAPLGTWLADAAEPAADFRAAFGEAAPAPTHVIFSVDTDDLGGRALARLAAPEFRDR
jgi:hypothetical protein